MKLKETHREEKMFEFLKAKNPNAINNVATKVIPMKQVSNSKLRIHVFVIA